MVLVPESMRGPTGSPARGFKAKLELTNRLPQKRHLKYRNQKI